MGLPGERGPEGAAGKGIPGEKVHTLLHSVLGLVMWAQHYKQ